MKKSITLLLLAILSHSMIYARVWTMENCIKYAAENNLTIKDNELNTRLAELSLQQSRLAQLPSVNGAGSGGRSHSSILDPTSGNYNGINYNFMSFNGNADVLLFGWFARRNMIAKNKFSLQAARADFDQLKEDISLNVATGYLRAVMAQERITIAQKQIALTVAQLGNAGQQVVAGTGVELDEVLLRSQLSVDSTNFLYALSVYNSSILDLKALLALPATADFQVTDPADAAKNAVDMGGIPPPEGVYTVALDKMARIKGIDMRLAANERQLAATRAIRYPQLSFVTQLSTVYTNISKDYTANGYNSVIIPSTYIEVNGTQYPVYQSTPTYNVRRSGFGEQLGNNMSSIYALSLNIPIFNGYRAQYNAHTAKIALQSERFKKDEALMQLRSDIYKAYDEVTLSVQKYNASRNAVAASQNAMYYSKQRMGVGLMTTIEYLQVQNRVFAIEEQMLAAKYDYILKTKIIDYYMGRSLAF